MGQLGRSRPATKQNGCQVTGPGSPRRISERIGRYSPPANGAPKMSSNIDSNSVLPPT